MSRAVEFVVVVSLPFPLTTDLLPLAGEQTVPPAPTPPGGGGWGVVGWVGDLFGPVAVWLCNVCGLSGIGARSTGESGLRVAACCRRLRCSLDAAEIGLDRVSGVGLNALFCGVVFTSLGCGSTDLGGWLGGSRRISAGNFA